MVRCGRTLRRGSIKAYFVGVDDHIDPRLQGTNQGLGYTLTWQNGRQLASMRFGTVNIGFTYDVDGLRTSKTVYNVDLEHKYYYVGNRLQYETIGDSSALWYFYDADGNPSGIRYKDHNGTVNDYYFVCNWRGDVIQIYNAAGELVSTYDYDAWGRVSENSTDKDTQNIAEINPIRYRGYYYDSETGLYYVNSRYYDPATKRFVNSDNSEIIDGSNAHLLENNLFAYCFNNPTNMIDEDGNWPQWAKNLLKVGIGVAAIGIGVAATVATGGAAAPVLLASIKIAATSAAFGALTGAGLGAISSRLSTGNWKSAGKAALRGAIDGAADGFMWGGISAGATFTTVAVKKVQIQQIGRLKPQNKSGKGYIGVKYKNKRGSTKSFELHSPHKSGSHRRWHWQLNKWNTRTGAITGRSKHWTIFGRRF